MSVLRAQSHLLPTSLKVEYMDAPMGLDRESPRFSWILEEQKAGLFDQRQTAYRILVASSETALRADNGDVWDTEWVNSNQMSQVVYKGPPLLSDQRYYWKVAVRDQDHQKSKWSEAVTWTTGLFRANEWRGKWIGGQEQFDPNQEDCTIWDPWLRKTFELKQLGAKAHLYVASIGYHELYVNGKRVGDEVLAPIVSDHTKRARYVVYDIAPYLRKGKNVIGLWLGTSWSIFPPYDVDGSRPLLPLVSAQLSVYPGLALNEEPIVRLETDDTWRHRNSPNKLLGSWDFWNMGGELWDDRRADDRWNQSDYDDSQWSAATVYPLDLEITASNTFGNKKKRKLQPQSIARMRDGSFKVDMGENFAGWTRVKVKGEEGDTIRFQYSEREQDEMTFNLHSAFIIGPSGEGEFRNRFNYSSGRWITIKGLKEKPSLEDIEGWMIRSDFTEASHFSSSDSLQNWLYDRIKWTFENLSIGGFIVDCPQRERMGYGGDAHASSETGMMNYQLGAFYTKWMEDWRDVQGTEPMVGNMRDPNHARKGVTSGRILNNGILPHTAPTYWGGGGPSWGGIVVSLPYFMYEYYGDTQVLVDNYELMKGWLGFLDTHVEDHLLQRFGGPWDFLGDWLWPNATEEGMNNDKPETLALNNSYRVYNLRTAAKIARILGDLPQAEAWEYQASASARAIHERFFDPQNDVYADGSMANLATALLAEVVPDSLIEKVKQRLEEEILKNRKGHIHAGITGGALLFKWLRQEGRNDLIYSMTSKTTYPSWGYMRDHGATTIWEMWEKDLPGHSLLHSSYLYPGAWPIDVLGGIKPESPGLTTVVISPPMAHHTDLNWVKSRFLSPVGEIKSAWDRRGGRLALSIRVPPNSSAILKISKHETIDLSRYAAWIKELPAEGMFRLYELPSGSYRID
ncbi:MAG: family 78 glycoside hydrolase catalytic domain [Sphingobacterium sp.]